jgi:tetratricopeptide (TPR) repeat protein
VCSSDLELHQNGAPGFGDLAPERIHYLEGNFLFWYNDLDQALDHIERVTAKAREVDLNTGIMSWMRLGQIYDLQHRRAQAVAAYRKAIAMAPQSEVGRESRGYIRRPYRRKPAGEARANEKRETRNEKRKKRNEKRTLPII